MRYQKLLPTVFLIMGLVPITIVQSATINNPRTLFLDDFVRQCRTSADESLCTCLGKSMYAEFSPVMRKISKETYRTWRSDKNLTYTQALTIAKQKLIDDAQYAVEAELLIKKMPDIWSKVCFPEELVVEKEK